MARARFRRRVSRKLQDGMALLEALISLLIFSIAVLGLIGIQANMVTNTTEAQFRSTATYIAQQKIGRFWANPSGVVRIDLVEEETSQEIDPNLLPSGYSTVSSLAGTGTLRVTVTWGVSEEEHLKQVSGEIPRFNNVTIDARVMEWDE
ncbi:type IV pilus modification PilV family protein [Thauera sp. Sel9]|uniref:type IV pilus modification PilV family protein n=1 Tax=Thauera sp. Sel9 TaxID=2974299 RepID=UPI0021E11954|nr:type IV pilus modification protein PilV [Thauera sp. Sel9]MCV2217921.1 type IV pilus modification protein PilV [Thauera sp. Sel9]